MTPVPGSTGGKKSTLETFTSLKKLFSYLDAEAFEKLDSRDEER